MVNQARFFAAQAIREHVEIKGLATAAPTVHMRLTNAWSAFIVNPHSDRPLWRPWLAHIFTYCALPNEYWPAEE